MMDIACLHCVMRSLLSAVVALEHLGDQLPQSLLKMRVAFWDRISSHPQLSWLLSFFRSDSISLIQVVCRATEPRIHCQVLWKTGLLLRNLI